MTAIVIIFMIVATIFAIASLAYVAADVVIEQIQNAVKSPEPTPAPVVIVQAPPPEPEPEPEPEPPVIVERIDAEEADAMMSDADAMQTVFYESPAGHGKQGIINVGQIDAAFETDDVVTLAELKARGLVAKSYGRVKVLADGILSKPLTIKAEAYSVQAIKMIELTGGKVVILKD